MHSKEDAVKARPTHGACGRRAPKHQLQEAHTYLQTVQLD